jgi:hypothetical protein
MNRVRNISLAGIVMLLTLTATTVHAQSFFERGKNLLKGLDNTTAPSSVLSTLTSDEISEGLREALRVGAERVVNTLGQTDGFNKASDIHIPLPNTLKTAQSMLSKIGQSGLADDLELRLNRAAEAAVPAAKTHFADAIKEMTIDDAKMILEGPKDSATQYFRRKMSAPLTADMKPIVDDQLSKVGVIASYDKMMGQYKNIPFAPDVKADLTEYVLEKSIDGVFLYLGREEAAIRENPAKRTTELLQKVFGQ